MKKDGERVFVVIFLISIVLVLSVSFVSASILSNIGDWVDQRIVVNKTITIPALGLIKLDTGKDNLGQQVFAGWNNLNVNATSLGNYRVYARFESNGKFVDGGWDFNVV
jgi:hypothetical protein